MASATSGMRSSRGRLQAGASTSMRVPSGQARMLSVIWVALAKRGISPSSPAKFAAGLFMCGVGFYIMLVPANAVIAAGGVLLRPQVIREIRDSANETVYRYGRTEIGRAVSPRTAFRIFSCASRSKTTIGRSFSMQSETAAASRTRSPSTSTCP